MPENESGLSRSPDEYRDRLQRESDEQIDAWAAELMRDLSIRRGVRRVLHDFMRAAALDERSLEFVFTSGGAPPAVVGRTAAGELMVPAISLHHLVTGLRRETTDARERLTRYLVANFHEIVYT